MIDSVQSFWNDHAAWSDATFGAVGALGPLRHLEKEAREAAAEVAVSPEKLAIELADCLMLTFDAARRSGLSLDDLIHAARTKLDTNKGRSWGPRIDGMPIEHV